MGRMADILKSAERRPAGGAALPASAVPTPSPAPPWAESDETVPFIEIGGPREPALRLIPSPPLPPPEPSPAAGEPEPEPDGQPGGGGDDGSGPPGLFTIRFQPVLSGRLPGRGVASELIAYHQPHHPVSAQYRALAAEIMAQLPGHQPRAILFTSAGAGAGTSTVLLNLAITLAHQEDTRVAVVDAHFDRPALAQRLGLTAGPGLREALIRQTPLSWCVQETAQPNLVVLPAGRPATPRTDAALAPLLEHLRERHDWVLVDAAPWGDGPEVAELAEGSDAAYLVLRHTEAGTPAALALQEAMLERTGRLRGCVVTQS